MLFMVMVKATANSEAGEMPDEAMLTAMGRYNEELAAAGVLEAGEGLHPSSRGVRVRFAGAQREVAEGPFPATNELVAGFWIFRCESLQACIEWVRRCPNPMPGESEIEIRPVFDMEDFGEQLTPELRDQEQRLRNPISPNKGGV